MSIDNVQDIAARRQYVAGVGQTVFAYPFPIFADSDLVVDINGTTKLLTTNYTVSGAGADTGGNVTLLAACVGSEIVTIYRNLPIQRTSDFQSNGPLSSVTFNDELDKLVLMVQQVKESVNRALRIPITANVVDSDISLDPSTWASKYLTFDTNGKPLPAALSSTTMTQAVVGGLLFPRTQAEITASVVPTNLAYVAGDVRRYGPALDGVTDDTVPLQNWAKVPGRHTFPVAQTALITAAIPLVSNSTYEGVEGAIIQTATHDINLFQASTKNHIIIRGLHFKQTSAGSAASIGGVLLDACTDCTVEYCEFEGMQFAGIWSQACVRCTFRGNYIHDPLGGGIDSCDIYVASSVSAPASFNVIDGNFCYGTTFEFGIAVWDPYVGVLPLSNVVCNNRIGAHNGYGILIYMTDAGDSFTQIIANHVQDISAHSTNTSSGTGIYLAGQGIGGTQVISNTVQNCCITTSAASLAPGGIGVNGSGSGVGSVPLVIADNTVEGMTKYNGILLTGWLGGASVDSNVIRFPLSNVTGDALVIANCNNVSVTANNLWLDPASARRAISFFAQSAACTNCSAVANVINGGNRSYIETTQTGGSVVTGLIVNGNVGDGGGNSCNPLNLSTGSAADVTVTGNYFSGGSGAVVLQSAITNVRYANNRFKGTGATTLNFLGVNTGSRYDASNLHSGGAVSIAGSGLTFVQEGIVTVTYSASMTFDVATGDEFDITATNNTAFTINAPTNVTTGRCITVKIRNTSGGALGAVTWNAVFKLSAWTSPATANSRSIAFAYDGTNWVQTAQTGVDVPN